ncbi:hypothetical protein PGT21_004636 [Puccinia graminis f. sp. tritici]|uniref:Conserved oligomeric Golgi complex subunit 4 n=1 Tax=Puccinia graminis f. sp. tritici TaxID=56615 RepID=A0A5B0SHN0_PUCGR|nr:hypothetical protein PGT21_004636 [Puccinia graminis f. sp. tritici]KAA1137260.1 hypothetical protein PGTUg99_013461 [Puccinia graminis f. sp. tritici]
MNPTGTTTTTTTTTVIAPTEDVPIYSRERLAGLHSHLDLVNALTHLESIECQVDQSLSKLLSSSDRIDSALNTIGEIEPIVRDLSEDASALHEVVIERAEVAERISSKVRVLDLEQSRVKDCIDRVQSAAELKDAFHQLFQAIEYADWEAATRHVQRANAIDRGFLTSHFVEAVVPTANIPEPPAIALENLIIQLTETFLKSFNAAAQVKDEAATTRFFKLFPLLGPSASEAGLAAYSDFVRTLISVPSSITRPTDGAKPASIVIQLTSIVEQLALIIDQHQGVVDKYYGPRSMVTVALKLNKELDRLMGRLISAWETDQQLNRKLLSVQRYSFAAQNQLLTANNVSGSSNPINSPAALHSSLRSLAGNVQRTYNLPQGSASSLNSTAVASHDEDTEDPREIDFLIAELAGMSSRWQTYRRFLHVRFGDVNLSEAQDRQERPEQPESPISPSTIPKELHASPPAHVSNQFEQLEQTELSQKLSDYLERLYLPLESWYLRINIEKAHSADEMDFSASPYLSSALDDTFYMTKKVMLRLISIGSVKCVRAGLLKIEEIIQRDFGEVMKRRLESVSSNLSAGTSVGFGIKISEEKEKRERSVRNSCVVYLNNLSMASEYVVRLIDEVTNGPIITQSFFIPIEINEVKSCMGELQRLSKKLTGINKSGLEQLFNQLIRSKIRSILSDCYKDVTYVLDDQSYAEAEVQDLFRKRFQKAWELLMDPYRDSMTSENFKELIGMTVNVIVRTWENMIKNQRFNELGSIKFDKDIRSISSFLSNQTSFGISLINESFIRLKQISSLLLIKSLEDHTDGDHQNEDDEQVLKDFLVAEDINWRLNISEIKAVLAQKI